MIPLAANPASFLLPDWAAIEELIFENQLLFQVWVWTLAGVIAVLVVYELVVRVKRLRSPVARMVRRRRG